MFVDFNLVYLFNPCVLFDFCVFDDFCVMNETLRCSLRIRRGNLTDSIAVVAEGGGDGGFGTASGFKKENVNCALIEGVNCAS